MELFYDFFNSTFIWYTPPADQESKGSLYDVDSGTRCHGSCVYLSERHKDSKPLLGIP